MTKFSSKAKNDTPRRRQSAQFVRTPALPDTSSQFRRNQTMSGVRRLETEPQSERARLHHLAERRRTMSALLALVLGVVVVLGVLLTQFTGSVAVTGSSAALERQLDAAPYEAAITEYLGLHPVERLRFALNEDALTSYVADQLPEVAAVRLSSVTNVIESNFTLTLHEPVAGWQINGRQYYVDSTGVVFQKNFFATPTVQIVDQSGISPEQGSVIASARLLSLVGRVVALAGEGSYVATEAILPAGTTRAIQIRLKNVTPLVTLSIDRGAGEQVEDMIRSLKYLDSVGRTAQYIDVRISGRAAYR
jgi:cell division septal protein FtsQ